MCENITYESIKEGLKRPYSEVLKSLPQERGKPTYQAFSVTNPNFRGKPFAKSSTIVIGTSKSDTARTTYASSNQDTLRKKKLRLDRKYAHDPSYLKNRKSKVVNVRILEGSTNSCNRTKTLNVKKHVLDPNNNTMIAPKAGRNTSHEEINVHNNNNKQTHPFGSIVAISGSILDPDKYEATEDPPIFYGVV